MRSALIKGAVQAAALGNLCAAKQDFKLRSELGFLPVENGQTGLSAPKIEAPDLMRLPWEQPMAGPFFANLGGFLLGLILGFPGITVDAGDVTGWPRRTVVLPTGWQAIEIERLWIHGR